MNLISIKRANKKKPLTPREKAVLCLWDMTKGEFDLKEGKKYTSISKLLLKYKNVYSESELEALVTPLYEKEFDQFKDWRRLIMTTMDYDIKGFAFYKQALSYVNEAYLYLHKMLIYKTPNPSFYSINCSKEVNYQKIIDEAYHSMYMFHRFLIPILVNQILLQYAFDDKNELQSVMCLTSLNKVLSQTVEDPRIINLKNIFSDILKTNGKVVKDHLYYLGKSYDYCFPVRYLEDNKSNIKRLVKIKIKEYCPALYPNHDNEIKDLVE